MTPKPILLDALRQDATNTLAFLRALDAVLPGHVEEGLLGLLDAAAANDSVLALMALALTPKDAAGRARTA